MDSVSLSLEVVTSYLDAIIKSRDNLEVYKVRLELVLERLNEHIRINKEIWNFSRLKFHTWVK